MAAAPQQQQQQQQQQPQQPSSSAAASTEQHAPLFTSGVLPVMLQHPDISRSHKTVCRLLRSSKALRSAVLQHAGGMVELRLGYRDRRAKRYCSWLSRHGRLLTSLAVDDNLALADSVSLACALQESAAAAPGGLRLQALEVGLPSAMAGLVLQPLPPQHLTRLDLRLNLPAEEPVAAHQQPDPCVQLTARALAGLTNLSALTLRCARQQPSDDALVPWLDPILPALSGFTRLTRLELSGCSRGRLSLLPQQLVWLDVFSVAGQPSGQLQLGHLTALTCLDCSPACVQAGDVLPANLLSLVVGDCSATGLLAALTRLTRLELQQLSASMSVAGLVSGIAGRLQQLQELQLTCAGDAAAAVGPAAVWPAAAAAAVLPALRELLLEDFPGSMLLGAADAISRLCALTRLTLYAGDDGGQDAAALAALARAIAALPRLRDLDACNVDFGRSPAAVELLSGATSLTSLTIWGAGLTDHSVSRMFAFGRLTGLRSLDIQFNPDVSLPLALMIVGCLPHLTALNNLSEMGGSTAADNECRRQIGDVLRQHRQAERQ